MTMFSLYCFSDYRSAELIKATVIIIKSITDTVPAIDKVTRGTREDVAQATAPQRQYEKFVTNTMSKIQATYTIHSSNYNDLVLQHQKI
jgi:hypothetical protein